MAHIAVIEPEQAEGRLAEIYNDLIRKRGKLANVLMVQSLHPESLVAHMELYLSVMFSQSPLSRAERELMAVVVSLANDCVYCQQHHRSALAQYWKDEDRMLQLFKDPYEACRTERELELTKYAINLTLFPQECNNEHWAVELKQAGFEDRAILDATLVVAYFNFVNRMVLGLGVTLEIEAGAGYKY